MSRSTHKLIIELNLSEAAKLAQYLASLIGKGSLSTTPAWARRIVGKICKAAREQYPSETAETFVE